VKRDSHSLASKRPLLVLAPGSPTDARARERLIAEAERREVTVTTLPPQDGLRSLDRVAAACRADALAVCGGAGAQAVVAAVAAGRDLPYACIPSGAADLLARELGAGVGDPVAALERLLGARERRIDLAEVNGVTFINYVALGLRVSAIAARGDSASAGEQPRDLARVRRGRPSGLADRRAGRRGAPPAMLVSNNRFALRGEHLGPRARIDGGVLGVAVLENPVDAADGSAVEPGWRERWCTRLELIADAPVLADVDGIMRRLQPPLRFRCVPGALRLRLEGPPCTVADGPSA
jgi:diacylglycerol kinase family enzyme